MLKAIHAQEDAKDAKEKGEFPAGLRDGAWAGLLLSISR